MTTRTLGKERVDEERRESRVALSSPTVALSPALSFKGAANDTVLDAGRLQNEDSDDGGPSAQAGVEQQQYQPDDAQALHRQTALLDPALTNAVDDLRENFDGLEQDDGSMPYISDDIAKTGRPAQELEAVLQSVPFDFAQVEPELGRATRKRSSIVIFSALMKELASIQLSTKHESGKRRREIIVERKRKLKAALRLLLAFATLLESIYVLISVPLRIGFLFDPWSSIQVRGVWTNDLTILSTLDIVGEIILLTYMFTERRMLSARFAKGTSSQLSAKSIASTKSVGRSGVVIPQPSSHRIAKRLSIPDVSLFSVRDDDKDAASGAPSFETASVIQDGLLQEAMPMPFKFFLCLPLDIISAVFLNYSWLHLARAVKLVVAGYSLPVLYSSVRKACRRFRFVRMLSFSTLNVPFQLFWIGLYLCHVSACGYMLIAHVECGIDFSKCSRTPVPGCWVLKDHLERGSFWRQYVRTMYWASKTITTLGQGDLLPTTQFETSYCIIVQFISGLWATSFLSACSFYFSRRDADLDNCTSTRLEQALTFLRNRHVPTELADHIRAYHQYLQRTRSGVEENRILTDLPAHYHKQCSSYVMLRLIRRVPFFSTKPKEFMKTLLPMIESDFLSPNQTVIGVYDMEELIVVERGEIRVLDVDNKLVVHTIKSGQWYAEHALFQERLSHYELVAGTFCEVYCLTRQRFLSAMNQHFPKMKIALLQAQYVEESHVLSSSAADASAEAGTAPHNNSDDQRLVHLGSVSKTSHLLKVASAVPWHFPNSHFRRAWRRWKVALTIYLAIEVPFEIAFDWRGGVFGQNQNPRQLASYALALVVEVFFYTDVYLRARVFARNPNTGDQSRGIHSARAQENHKTAHTSQIRLHHGLIEQNSELTRHYLNHGDVLLDFVATLPISMAWGLISKDSISYHTMYYMRFFRLLALVRLSKLEQMMRKIMREYDLSPASQLLVNVIVFCVISASAVGCCFFLVADVEGFDFGTPPNFAGPGSVSVDQCLEDATVSGNCTWFVYDLSTYNIHARYIRSLHWSVVLLSTVGYGDILAFSDSECFIGFWWILLGALICYFTACAVSSVISQATVLSSMRSKRAEAINRALVRTGVSSSTRRIIRRHFETNWTLNGSVLQEAEVLRHLPRSQRHELACSLYLADLCRCYIFASFHHQTGFLKDVALLMRSEIFVPKMVLMNYGHLATEMYLIQSGDVEILIPRAEKRHRVYDSDFLTMLGNRSVEKTGGRMSRPKSLLERLFNRKHSFGSDAKAEFGPKCKKRQARRGIWDINGNTKMLPIRVMGRGDCFGEESLLPNEQFEAKVSVRTVTSTQVAVLERDAVAVLFERYPEQAAQMHEYITTRRQEDAELFQRVNANIAWKGKVSGFLGSSSSLYAENNVHANHIIGPESLRYKLWRSTQGCILLYNFFQITFRIAFLPDPSRETMLALTLIDYSCDLLLFADIYLKWNRLGFTLYGDRVVDIVAIRKRYLKAWFRLDCLSMLPTYYVGDHFVMTLCRLPRLLRTPQLLEIVGEFEERMRERLLRSGNLAPLSWFDLLKFLMLFLSAGHHIGSIYYAIGRLMVKHNLAPVSWITVDTVLNAYPDNIVVHYMRSLYWCLETFTVVCFGEIMARNTLETFYSGSACVIGWFFIGQIMGQITSLMAVMDMEQHEHNERVEAFEQYAKKKHLPSFLRERSKEGLEYKSKCLIDLSMAETFHELPKAFHMLLFDELYGDMVRNIPELTDYLLEPRLQAFINALRLELYLPEDLIIEEGRIGSKLFIMKSGTAEIFSPHTGVMFAAVHEGVLFGDVSFFLSGTKQLASIRASRSCEVLYLHRREWMKLWSDPTRASIENGIVPVMKQKYSSMSRAFMNISKNIEQAKLNTSVPKRAKAKETIAGATTEENDENDDGNETEDAMVKTDPVRAGSTHYNIKSTRYAVDSAMKGKRRKLSAHLGFPQYRHSPRAPRKSSVINEEWSHHTQHLDVHALLDQQSVDKTDVHAFAHQSSDPGTESEILPYETTHASDLNAMGSSATLPSRIASDRTMLDNERRDETGVTKHATISRGFDSSPTIDDIPVDSTIQLLGQEKKKSHASNGPSENTPDALSHAGSSEATKKTNIKQSLDENAPFIDPENCESESHLSALSRLQQYLPFGTSAASLKNTSHRKSEGQLYATHLETLKARSKRRLHQGVFQNGDAVDAQTNPFEIWVEPRLPPSFCLENSSFRHIWNAVMVVICYYYVLVVPFRISFDFEFLTRSENSSTIYGWFAIEYIMDVICITDFFLQKNYFTYIYKGEIVTDKQAIRDHYIKDGTYLADLFCILPFEVLTLLYSAILRRQGIQWDVTWYRIAVFRTNKMVRILRLHELSERLQRTLLYDWKLTFITPGSVYFVRFAFDFVLGAHWVACFFYAVSYNTFFEDGRLSWLTTPGMLTFTGCTGIACIGDIPIVEKYARSYHFGMGAITTVSYGDIAPQNAIETLSGMFVIVVSIVLFGMLAGGFFHLYEMDLKQRAAYEERVARVANYMGFHRFHLRIWKQVQVYFAVHWRESKGMDEDEQLRGLPTSVRQDIVLYVKREFVVQVKLFATYEEAFIRAVVTSFQQELYVRHDVIIAEGDSGRSLYVIENGTVLVRVMKKQRRTIRKSVAASAVDALRGSEPEFIEIVMGKFDFFGEKSLILDVPRSATCVALSSCSMLILTVEKYREILDDFPEYCERNMRDWLFAHPAQDESPA